jgi:hypothetical protein
VSIRVDPAPCPILDELVVAGTRSNEARAGPKDMNGTARHSGTDREDVFLKTTLQHVVALAAMIATSTAAGALAQAAVTDPENSGAAPTETAPSAGSGDTM